MQTMQRVQSFRQARTQKGFTIIELVVVILLLGILAATALPRFMDVTDEAHAAVVDGLEGGLVTGASLFRAQYVANGAVPGTLVAGFGSDTGILFSNTNGYPTGISAAFDENSCLEIYNGLLQSGRPAATFAIATESAAPVDTDDFDASLINMSASADDIDAKATDGIDIVAVTSSQALYCKNNGATAACVGDGIFLDPAAAETSVDGDAGADYADLAAAQAAAAGDNLFTGGSCNFYYTGQYNAVGDGLTIPYLTLSLTDGGVTRSTLTFE